LLFSLLILSLLVLIVPVIFILLLIGIFSEDSTSVRHTPSHWGKAKTEEPFRWVAPWQPYQPSHGFSRHPRPGGVLDEVRVYKELVNYLNKMYLEGRVNPEVYRKLLSEFTSKINMLESDERRDGGL